MKLRIAWMSGSTATQILAKMVRVLPLSGDTDALIYMRTTAECAGLRFSGAIISLIDASFGRADSTGECSWRTAFTDFRRESDEIYNDFWERLTTFVGNLDAIGMATNEQVVFDRSAQASRLP